MSGSPRLSVREVPGLLAGIAALFHRPPRQPAARRVDQQQRDDEERHQAHQHGPDPEEEQTADDHPPAQPEQRSARKQQILLDFLSRPEGATIPQLIAATGWQAHSVRGVMSGVLKKKLGMQVTSSKVAGGARIYRVASEDKATPAVELG